MGTIFDVVSLVASVVDVCLNPNDPWAWAGLAGDAIDLIPFVTGVGEVTKAVSAANKIVDTADTIHDAANAIDNVGDAAKVAQKGWHVGDNVATLTRAGNTPSWSTVRQRYWKNTAASNMGNYSQSNLSRMKKGLAPLGEDGFSMELHHPLGREGSNFFNFVPLTQTEHRAIHYWR